MQAYIFEGANPADTSGAMERVHTLNAHYREPAAVAEQLLAVRSMSKVLTYGPFTAETLHGPGARQFLSCQ